MANLFKMKIFPVKFVLVVRVLFFQKAVQLTINLRQFTPELYSA